MSDIVLEHLKLLKLCFIIAKIFGLLGLHVVAKKKNSSFLVIFDCLKMSGGVSLAFNSYLLLMNWCIFVLAIVYLQFFKALFFHVFILDNYTYSSCKGEHYICRIMPWVVWRKWDISLWACWFALNVHHNFCTIFVYHYS